MRRLQAVCRVWIGMIVALTAACGGKTGGNGGGQSPIYYVCEGAITGVALTNAIPLPAPTPAQPLKVCEKLNAAFLADLNRRVSSSALEETLNFRTSSIRNSMLHTR